jgi:hypothetical protein
MSDNVTTGSRAVAEELLGRLCDARIPPQRLIMTAHPDDEVFGAGPRGWRDALTIAQATDGALPDENRGDLAGSLRVEITRARAVPS